MLPRTISTGCLWLAIIVAYMMHSEALFLALIAFPALLALWEYFALLRSGGVSHHRWMGMTIGCLLIAVDFWFFQKEHRVGPLAIFALEGLLLAVLVMGLFLREYGRNDPSKPTAEAIAFTLFGVLYIPWLFLFMGKILYLTPRTFDGHPTGQYLVLFVMAVTKFTDVGAYLSGSLFGRTPFFPNISPKKTWEGIAGGVLLGVLVGVAIFHFLHGHLPIFRMRLVCALSLFLAIAGVAGDLAESLLKRSLHSKDSGHTLPGIGGALDLIDSLLFTLPLFYLFLIVFLIRHQP